jgi:hypothetical protein
MTKAAVALVNVARVKRGFVHDHGPFVCRRCDDGASLRRGHRRRLLFLHVIKPIGSSTPPHKLSRYSLKRQFGRKPTLPSASVGAQLALAEQDVSDQPRAIEREGRPRALSHQLQTAAFRMTAFTSGPAVCCAQTDIGVIPSCWRPSLARPRARPPGTGRSRTGG